MKRLLIFVLSLFVLSLAGCSSTPTPEEGPGAAVEQRGGPEGAVVSGTPEADGTYSTGAVTAGATGPGEWSGNELDDPASPLSTRTLYFPFDSSDIAPEYFDALRSHARYLAANPSLRLTLEGHADERGSREYNLALGERRARRVRQYLMAEGVDGAQLSEISYGEERPVDPGQGETAWSHNRRVELVY